jgi:hypothetical protein
VHGRHVPTRLLWALEPSRDQAAVTTLRCPSGPRIMRSASSSDGSSAARSSFWSISRLRTVCACVLSCTLHRGMAERCEAIEMPSAVHLCTDAL